MMMSTNNIPSSRATTGGGCGGSNSGGGGSGGGAGGSGGGGPCGACKFLRRKCVAGCIFAPYFDSEQGAAHFAAVHKVFGASNVSKLLLHIPVHKRLDAVITICYEAQARLRDPVYGCVAHIFALQQQVVNLQAELTYLHAHLATMELPTPPSPPPAAPSHPQPPLLFPSALTIQDLAAPSISVAASSFDLSTLFEPVGNPCQWTPNEARHHQLAETRLFPTTTTTNTTTSVAREIGLPPTSSGGGSGDDLHELACELLNRHAPPVVQCTRNQASSSSALPPHST